jgi:hypothetical protein
VAAQPGLIERNRYLDFGAGFYTTTSRERAEEFAQRMTVRCQEGTATLNSYTIDEETAFAQCRLLSFDGADERWLDFVAANRQGETGAAQYDLIYGAAANDAVYQTLILYMETVLTKTQALEALQIQALCHQLVFATEKALRYLRFEGSEQV